MSGLVDIRYLLTKFYRLVIFKYLFYAEFFVVCQDTKYALINKQQTDCV